MTFTLPLNKRAVTLEAAACALLLLPFWAADQYQLHLAALIAVYWVLIAGLNLVVGYTGQLSIGHVGLLSIGSYAFCILVGKWGLDPYTSTAVAGMLGGLCGLALGLPSLRLPGFYFAMATMAFALIVNEIILAQVGLTGGGVGLTGGQHLEGKVGGAALGQPSGGKSVRSQVLQSGPDPGERAIVQPVGRRDEGEDVFHKPQF